MVAGVGCWRKKKKVCKGERYTGRRRERDPQGLLGGREVVVLASFGGAGGNVAWSLQWRREREREREREGGRNWEEADFMAYFGPSFLLPQGLKSTSIYRRWKWAILSTLGKNFNP
jgi:hypothetical protein